MATAAELQRLEESMRCHVERWWERLQHVEEPGAWEAARDERRLNLLSLAAFFSGVMTLSFSTFLFITSHEPGILLHVPISAFYMVIPVLRRRLNGRLVKALLGFAVLLHFMLLSLQLGREGGTHYWAFVAVVTTYLMTGRTEADLRVVFVGTSVFLLSAVELGIIGATPLIATDPWVRDITSFLVYVAGLAITWLVVRRHVMELEAAEDQLSESNELNESLLRNTLPDGIVTRLRDGEEVIADKHECATVLFCDIVGFTVLAQTLPPTDVVDLLNVVFRRFDDIAEELHVEKIKTIGDAYMVAAGLPEHRDDHAEVIVHMAQRMLTSVQALDHPAARHLDVRIGIHTGPVVAGIIGKSKFAYDLWGDTVNTAARMESHGEPGKIQVSREVYVTLQDNFNFEARGKIEIKGKGEMETYFVTG